MRTATLLGCVAVFLCAAFVGTAVATTDIMFVNTDPAVWYVKQDPCVMSFNLEWTLPPGDKRDFFDGDQGLVSLDMTADRATCWRMEVGNPDHFDWPIIRTALALFYGTRVGEKVTCDIGSQVLPPMCFRATLDVYAPYAKDFYRIEQNDNVAIISVLRPIHGMALVYRNALRLPYSACDAVELPASVQGLCASLGSTPFVGDNCPLNDPKREFEEQPVISEPIEGITWGKIKALYGDE